MEAETAVTVLKPGVPALTGRSGDCDAPRWAVVWSASVSQLGFD